MSMYEARQEIAKFYRNALPQCTVLEYGGSFDLEEVKRIATRTPALVVTCLGVSKLNVEGGAIGNASTKFALFAVATNTVKEMRDVAALTLAEAVLVDLPYQRWDNKANNVPVGISANNLYSASLDKQGVSLWAIQWNQEVDLEKTSIYARLDSLTKVDVEYKPEPQVTGRVDTSTETALTGVP